MDTARAWKLSVGIATLMLIAVLAALVAAKGSLGFADWPAVADAPVPEETVVLVEPDPPAAPVREPRETEAPPPVAPADEAPEPVAVVRGIEREPAAPLRSRVETAPEPPAEGTEEPARAEIERDERADDRPRTPTPERLPLARPADAAIPLAPGHE